MSSPDMPVDIPSLMASLTEAAQGPHQSVKRGSSLDVHALLDNFVVALDFAGVVQRGC